MMSQFAIFLFFVDLVGFLAMLVFKRFSFRTRKVRLMKSYASCVLFCLD